MLSEIEFRSAVPEDLEAIADLVIEYHDEDHIVTDERRARSALARLLTEPALGRVWVAVRNETIVAYLVVAFGFSLELGGRDAFIDEVYVRRDHRRVGVASELLDSAGRDAASAGARALHLEVERTNGPARRVYERAGFIARERYHLMTRSLGDLS